MNKNNPALEQTQAQLKTKLEAANQISASAATKAAAQGGQWDAGDAKSFNALLGEIDALKMQAQLLTRKEELEDLAHSSDGVAVVPQTFGASNNGAAITDWRMAGPGEGLPTGEAIVRQDWKSGELVADNPEGARKVAALKSGEYKDALNRHLRGSALKGSGGSNDRWALKGNHMKVLNEGTDTGGGYWVTPEFNNTLVKKLATMTTLRQAATSFTTGSDQISFPKVSYVTDDKYTSGVRFNWSAENPTSNISESTNPVAGRVTLNVWTATAAILLTRANIEDAQFDIMGLCSQLMGEAFALGENDAGWNGDGVGKPQGVLGHANATVATASGGMVVNSGSASALTWGITDPTKGLIGLESALPPQYSNNSAWYGSKATFGAIRALTDSAVRPLWNPQDQYPNFTSGNPATLLGRPVQMDNFLPAIGSNTYPLVYGDLSGYWFADRVGITIQTLTELFALRDIYCIYARRRVGGALVHDWRVKVQKCAA